LLRLSAHRDATVPVSVTDGIAHADVKLSSSLGTFRVESRPAGATLRVDGKEVGVTPFDVEELTLDKPHRFDLEKRGFEPDSFIIVPDEEGASIQRILQQAR